MHHASALLPRSAPYVEGYPLLARAQREWRSRSRITPRLPSSTYAGSLEYENILCCLLQPLASLASLPSTPPRRSFPCNPSTSSRPVSHPCFLHPLRSPAPYTRAEPPSAWDHLLSIPAPFPVIPVKSITRWRQRRWCCFAGGAASPVVLLRRWWCYRS